MRGLSLSLSGAELSLLMHLLHARPAPPVEVAPGAWRSLRARRMVAGDPPGLAGVPIDVPAGPSGATTAGATTAGGDGLVQIDQFVAALVGTWLRPAAGLHVVALQGVDETREWDFHHLAALTVEHGLDTEGRHLFTGHATFPDLVQRLAAIVGLADQPGPAGERLWLAPEIGRRLWTAAGEEGAPGARRVLAQAEVDTATARSLARALEEARVVTHIEAYRYPAATGRPRSMGSLRLVEGPAGYWAFSQPPPEAPEAPEAPEGPDGRPSDGVVTGVGVDVRPLTAPQVGGLLTVMAGALGWPPAP